MPDRRATAGWTDAEYRKVTRWVVYTMLLGAIVAQIWSWAPSQFPMSGKLIVAMCGLAIALVAAWLWRIANSGGRWPLEVAMGTVPVIVSAGHMAFPRAYLLDAYASGTAAFYLWTTPVVVIVFGAAAGIRHTVVSSLCIGVSLVVTVGAIGQWTSIRIWTMVTATMIGMTLLGRVLHDVAVERIRVQAIHDPVTGLPNRRHLEAVLDSLIARNVAVVVIFLDLDNFKLVNDTLGHHAGDDILAAVGERLRDCLPRAAAIGRFGGDEFVAVVDASVNDVGDLRQRVESLWQEPFATGGQLFHLRGSAGLALSRGRADEARLIMREADLAVLAAKSRGRAQSVVFEPSMDSAGDDLDFAQALHAALRFESDALWVGYQPIVDLPTRRIVGVEALLRWTHPELGTVSPVRVVSVAERVGLINELGRTVCDIACRDLARLRAELGVDDLYVSINVSPMQILNDDFAALILATIDDAGIPRSAVRIEITEHLLVEDMDRALRSLTTLSEAGIRLSLDDFGTGYASLGYLGKLPVDTLKIDSSFVRDVETDARVFVEAIMALSRALAVDVVAEGIESEAEEAALRQLGCQYGQGYRYGKAVSVDELWDVLIRHYLTAGDAPGG
ncbi:EAL domain-containing protein [Gordonia sp. TBRC 11910]|uniref:EAL domain-containing protein n=1 Tax=Gordonia asplenii TaxID=2725283 RepID=A0A848KQQ5_9ACTN|nr:GGDEF domain-containing phosphodiesterase [Gordonia asplenii]NMO00389.1 EAL domain-containing protein [Gordonia asplenii]